MSYMKQIKLIVIFSMIGLVGIALNSSFLFVSRAENDEILEEIASYQTWRKVTYNPIKVQAVEIFIPGG